MQKAKHRASTVTKTVYVEAPTQSGNGYYKGDKKEDRWVVGDPPEKHPLFDLAGKYKDDPLFEETVQLMKKLRLEELERDINALEDAE